MPGLRGAVVEPWGLLHTKQALYQLNHIPSPKTSILSNPQPPSHLINAQLPT